MINDDDDDDDDVDDDEFRLKQCSIFCFRVKRRTKIKK
jgi:hypothetical protein